MNKYRDKAKRLDYVRAWREKNREKLREQNRALKRKHREKIAIRARERYHMNREKELDRIRFKKYGITGEQFRAIIEKQGIKCPICNKDITKNPSVDHDHLTGKIRGLICSKCNFALGNAEDSPDRLRAMANYLENAK